MCFTFVAILRRSRAAQLTIFVTLSALIAYLVVPAFAYAEAGFEGVSLWMAVCALAAEFSFAGAARRVAGCAGIWGSEVAIIANTAISI